MVLLLSTPFPFFLFLDTCLEDAVKKQVLSGLLDTTVYQCPATALGVLSMFCATIRKHLLRFWGNALT